jgi:hypothetical protein
VACQQPPVSRATPAGLRAEGSGRMTVIGGVIQPAK